MTVILEPVSVKQQIIPIAPEFKMSLDHGAEILRVGYLPNGSAAFFIRMNPATQEKSTRTFRLFPSGAPLGENWEKTLKYMDTFIGNHPVAGPTVFHCFEVVAPMATA